MRQLIERWGLRQPILDFAESGAPIFGTCAGMIVLARDIAGGEEPILPLLDVTVERNAFGRQLDSFEADLSRRRPRRPAGPRGVHPRPGHRADRARTSTSWPASTTAGSWPSASGTSSPPSFHPELAGETRFHRLVATMAAEHDDPGEGSGRRPHPTAARTADPMTATRPPRSPGKVRAARLTDLAALGELSRLCQSDDPATRSLGLPVSGPPIGVFSLFRLPLGAFRPNDLMYVYEDDGRIAGLVRVERESIRDEWTIVELDAVGMADAGDIRYRLVQQLLREGAKRGAARFHVACADADGNVELLMQAGFMRYGEERILFRPAKSTTARAVDGRGRRRGAASAPARPIDALALHRLYIAATPAPVARLEAIRLPDWERQGTHWRVPRSSLAPILRFADVEAFVQAAPDGGKDGTELDAFVQVGVAKEDQPHYLKVVARPEADADALIGVRTGHHRGTDREGRRASPRPRRHRTRANL